jgi:hypothetical protein
VNYPPADVITVDEELATGASELDLLGKQLGAAVEEYNLADEAWLKLYDAVAENLREEYRDAGRKTDPAEHVIVSETRRQHRAEYTRWKRAKRAVERIQAQMNASRTVVSARQTQAKGLRDEMKMGVLSR